MQIFFVDSVLRLAEKPAEAFSLKADFSFPHVNRLADSFRETLRVNRRVTLAELKQALAEWNIFVFDWALPYRISGMSFRGALTAIFINSLHDRTRRLFTLAHEFAHILFHLGRDQEHSTIVSMIASNQDPHEKEANAFASEFLMPSQDIDAVVRTHGDRLKDPVLLEAVARTFHVSRDAVFYRLAHHGVFRWEEKSKYFTKHTEPEPPQTRVTDIEEQVAGPFLETALSLYLQERASAGKLAEWFFAPRHVVEEYLSGLSRDQDNALASEPEHVPAGHHDGDANL
jgi:Zn-dependent peptidase ImmA (M78 family)